MLGQRHQLQGNLGDHSQRPLRTDDQLIEAIPGRALVQATTQAGDLAGGGHNFHLINLVACRAILYGPVATGVRRDISANKAAVATARVSRI